MRQEDICLRINGCKIEQFQTIVGELRDLSFFEHHKQYFRGRHKVVFRVGTQDIVSRVTLKGFDIEVKNEFIPIDVNNFVEAEKIRVSKEQEIAGFEDQLQNVYYISGKEILKCEILPSYNECNLTKAPSGPRFFVSHRWQSQHHPDPTGEHLTLLKRHARENDNSFYWIDFCCLPQPRLASDQKHFEKALPKLTSIQSKASSIIIMDDAFSKRLWCYVEHYFGVLFSQTNFGGERPRRIIYLGSHSNEAERMIESVQTLREPQWDTLRVTKKTDIPFIKQNYRFLTNIVKFQLLDRFVELYRSLPGSDLYGSIYHFPQSAFGLNYSESIERIQALQRQYDWKKQSLFEPGTISILAALLAHSNMLDSFSMNDLRFSQYLIRSKEMVALLAVLLSVIQQANRFRSRLRVMRTLYAKIVVITMLR